MPPRRTSSRRSRGRGRGSQGSQHNDSPVNPEMTAAVNQALTDMFPTLVTQLADALRQQSSQGPPPPEDHNRTESDTPPGAHHVSVERFQKHKPQSFSSAPTPVDAENWISHMDKIFDVLECPDNHKVRLAAYKLEGDAYRWWRTLKEIKGGDSFVDSLTWAGFCELFYQQYFSASDKDAYAREYACIKQGDKEPVVDYLARFVRLAGFAGIAAGSTRDQAEKFKWSLQSGIRSRVLSMKFTDVAEAANAAKDIERDRLENQAKRDEQLKKRDHPYRRPDHQNRGNRDGQNSRIQQGPLRGPSQNQGRFGQFGSGQSRFAPNQSQHQGRQPSQGIIEGRNVIIPLCNTCGKRHAGVCYRITGACYRCGQTGHTLKDCKGTGNAGGRNTPANTTQTATKGRVFALTSGQASSSPGTITGTLHIDNRELFVYLLRNQSTL